MSENQQQASHEVALFLELVEQHHLDESSNHVPPNFYWDTVDVTSALMGMSGLYQGPHFDRAEFASKRTLVRCLAAAGWLGRIHMLPPHQEELKNFLDRSAQSMRGSSIHPVGASQFLSDALGQYVPEIDVESSDYKEQIRDIVLHEAENAEALFKAIQSIGHLPTRLQQWQSQDKLDLAPPKRFDYMRAINTPQAERILSFLTSKRPELKINNFTDTMALCYLNSLLQDAARGKSPLPLLYVSSPTLIEAVRAVDEPDFMTYPAANANRVSILRGADYFIFRAVLFPKHSSKGASGVADAAEETIESLRRVISEMGKDGKPVTVDLLNGIHVGGKPLSEAILELKRLLFLDRVWLPFAAAQELEGATREYIQTRQQLATSESYKREMSQELLKTTHILESNVQAFTAVKELFGTVSKRVGELDASFFERAIEISTLENHYGLIRFGFNVPIDRDLQVILKRLTSTHDKERDLQIIELISTRGRADLLPATDFAILCSIFWILNMDSEIIYICRQRRRLPQEQPAWIEVMIASTLLRSRRDGTAEFEETIQRLRSTLASPLPPRDRSYLASGLGYIHFHWWQNKGGTALWRGQSDKKPETTATSIFNNAVRYAQEAFRESVGLESLHAYALNQFVFYVTEGGDEETFDRLSLQVDHLIDLEPNKTVWQYRYDDTLARYFHRSSVQAIGPIKLDLLNEAYRHISQAREACPSDKDVEAYASRLLRALASASAKSER